MPTKSAGDASRRKFTPYNINDYRSLSRTHNTRLGGLGANFDDNWEGKIKKNEKTKEFSKMIRGINSDKIQKQVVKPKIMDRQITGREKAMEFAKNVPRPKPRTVPTGLGTTGGTGSKSNPNNGPHQELDDEINRMEDDLEALERQHQFYQEKINKLKS